MHTEVPMIRNVTTFHSLYVGVQNLINKCEFNGFPFPNIIFYFNGAPITDSTTGVNIVNDTLTIPSPQISHSGIYQCIVSNEFGDDQASWLLEIRQPSEYINAIIVYPQNYYKHIIDIIIALPQVQPYNFSKLNAFDDRDLGALIVRDSGSTVRFIVNVVADPCPTVMWSLNGTILGPSNHAIMFNDPCVGTDARNTNWMFNLTVFLTLTTTGSYTANFTNFVGTTLLPKVYFTVPGMHA